MVKTQAWTIILSPATNVLIYSATEWTQARLNLISGGIVIYGTTPNLYPLGQGKGVQIPSNRDGIIVLAPSDRLYAASDSIQSVGVTIEGIPETPLLNTLIQAVQSPTQVITTEGKPPKWPFRF